jgi:FAD:protein FMN transferase
MLKRREFLKLSSVGPPSEGYWLHVNRTAMACRFEVTLPLSARGGVGAAQAALDEVDRLEQQLTIFRESSEVSFINRHAAAGRVRVEGSLFALLLRCQEIYRETEGAFDITSGPVSRCWGLLNRRGRLPERGELEAARALVGGEKLWLDRESRSVQFERPGVEINLGSVGKGYALDRVAGHMAEAAGGRPPSALLSAGASSLRAVGDGQARQGWLVGVRDPRDKGRRLATARLRDAALSTSGSEEQFFELNGKRYGHIVDPRSGLPAERVSSATVVAESAALTDALATAFYVGGPELAERYCAAHPEVLVLILESGSERPVIFGGNSRCELEVVNE